MLRILFPKFFSVPIILVWALFVAHLWGLLVIVQKLSIFFVVRLTQLFEQHDPSRLANIPKLKNQKGKEHEIYLKVFLNLQRAFLFF